HAGSGVTAGRAFAEQQNQGAPWHYQPISSPAGATGVQLDGVSCLSGWECHAVGTYYTGSGAGGRPLWAYWDGIRWRSSRPPAPVGSSQSSLHGISCTQDRNCTAVGTAATGSTGTGAPFVLRYS